MTSHPAPKYVVLSCATHVSALIGHFCRAEVNIKALKYATFGPAVLLLEFALKKTMMVTKIGIQNVVYLLFIETTNMEALIQED